MRLVQTSGWLSVSAKPQQLDIVRLVQTSGWLSVSAKPQRHEL